MDTVMLRSGKVVCILGTPVIGADGRISSYTPVTSTGAGSAHYKDSPWTTFQVIFSVTGTGSCTADIQGSNDGTNWVSAGAAGPDTTTGLGTITFTTVASGTKGFSCVCPWKFVRVNISTLSGTGASAYVLMGF